ncbi:MAG: response regulator, partial [Candidatus Rokuibacteriota bacterium]
MRTILVVDDDAWVRVLARDVLAADGYRVLEASDGQDAIRVASEHPGPIHLLLTDVVMPGMNGCELATGLAALLPGMKVMFMSAYDRDFLVAHGLDPIGPVVTKPFTIEYLARRV